MATLPLSDSEKHRGAEIIGEFGSGAYGPTIILKLVTAEGARWLHDLFVRMTTVVTSVTLTSEPIVDIRGLDSITLIRRHEPPDSRLRRITGGAFEWSATPAGWEDCTGLLEPFLQGRTGHQYLTAQGVDDAIIEVSFGEPDVRVPNDARGHPE